MHFTVVPNGDGKYAIMNEFGQRMRVFDTVNEAYTNLKKFNARQYMEDKGSAQPQGVVDNDKTDLF